MYKKQVRLFKRGYIINNNENDTENENRSYRYDINRSRLRHRHRYVKYKMCLSVVMVRCIKHYLKLNS